jgi:Tol biopolymer transport system component
LFRWALGERAPVPLDSADVIYDPDWGDPRREVHRRVAWSADGRVIVAIRPIVDDDEELVVFAADGSDRRTITVDYRLGSVPFRNPGSLRSIVGDRLFTTDGTTALDAPAATGGRLWVAPLSGGAAERVHPGDEAPRLSALASTPDGTTLVFVNRDRGLTVRDVDTGAERVVIDRTLGDVCLAPGADGRVAIGSRQGGSVSVVDLETGEVEAEVALPGQPSAPRWGSDGRILVPVSYDVPIDGVESQLFVIDPGSGRATVLPGSDGFALLPVTGFC